MVSCLRSRYEELSIYTYIGDVLIAINPFHTVNIYDQQVIRRSRPADCLIGYSTESVFWPPCQPSLDTLPHTSSYTLLLIDRTAMPHRRFV